MCRLKRMRGDCGSAVDASLYTFDLSSQRRNPISTGDDGAGNTIRQAGCRDILYDLDPRLDENIDQLSRRTVESRWGTESM